MGFGLSPWVRRYQGVGTVLTAKVRLEQRRFNAAHPYSPGVRAWQERRRARQRLGLLPPGPEEVEPSWSMSYLDDWSATALTDQLNCSCTTCKRLATIDLGAAATIA